MPIEIKELNVKVNVQESFKHSHPPKNHVDKKTLQNLKKEIMAECLEKVQELIDRQYER